MRLEMATAERAREVRDAARAWEKAGFVRPEVAKEIVALYPDDRGRLGPGFRTLVFIFAWMAGTSCAGFFFIPFSMAGTAASAFFMGVYGLALAALTEYQIGPLKRMDGGAESATGLMATGYVLAGFLWFVVEVTHISERPGILMGMIAASLWCAAAAWRWGERIYFLAAGILALLLLAQFGAARLAWLLAGAVGAWAAGRASRDRDLAPSHRTGAAHLAGLCLLACYLALHIGSLDTHLIEEFRIVSSSGPMNAPPEGLRLLSIVATGLFPVGLIALGARRRRPLLLQVGLLLLGASIVTIRAYRELMPLGEALVLIGAVCLVSALALRRWLRAGPGGERGGFTADPLLDDARRSEVMETALKVAAFTPAVATPAPEQGFKGGGGAFGGGGASGSF